MAMTDDAMAFFDTIENGKGWEACRPWCHDDAGFACQSTMLKDVHTLADYAAWMKGLIENVPDGRYEMKAHGATADGWMAFAVFHGTMKTDAGDKVLASDYVYAMTFEDGKVRHMTKIWNDGVL